MFLFSFKKRKNILISYSFYHFACTEQSIAFGEPKGEKLCEAKELPQHTLIHN